MREMQTDLPHIADACACSAIIAPPMTKHFSSGLGVFAARTSQMAEDIASYYVTLIYHDISCREQTRKVYGDIVRKVDVARFSKYALQVQVQ